MSDQPDCAAWPLPVNDESGSGYHRLKLWQDGRCGMCEGVDPYSGLVMDHDHKTGLIRGLLCRGCNTAEAHSDFPAWREWRAGNNTAGMLGIVEEYEYFSPGHKWMEEQMRLSVSDTDLDLIAEAVTR